MVGNPVRIETTPRIDPDELGPRYKSLFNVCRKARPEKSRFRSTADLSKLEL
jgi:hypothetical protein